MTSTRIKQLFEEKTTPRNRDDEIMGYRDVLNTIHESSEYIPIRPSYILQLHRDLLKRAGSASPYTLPVLFAVTVTSAGVIA